MGIHTGTVQLRATDYVGIDVHRAARIMGAGHGGQVLVSATSAAPLAGHLPATASLRDLGAHRLKDFAEPIGLFQLVHPDLATDFPPLATVDIRRSELPIPASPFVGRESELADLVRLLRGREDRLVTLLGPGGSGKTRLGLRVAAEVQGGLRRRRRLRGPRAGHRCRRGPRAHRDGRGRHAEPRATRPRGAEATAPRPGPAAPARQPGAGPRGRTQHRRAPCSRPGPPHPGDQSRAAPRPRRAPVPGPAVGPAGAEGPAARLRGAEPVRGDPAVRRAGAGGASRLRPDRRQRGRRGRHLPPPGRPAPGDRAGHRTLEPVRAGGPPGTPGQPPPGHRSRCARPPGAPADAALDHRLELPPARTRRAATVRGPLAGHAPVVRGDRRDRRPARPGPGPARRPVVAHRPEPRPA